MTEPELRVQPNSRLDRDRSMIRGVAWTGTAKWATQALSWGSTLIVARLLTPEDYGVVGATMIFVGFVHIVSEFGLGAAVVSRRDLTVGQLGALATFSLGLGVALCAVAFVGADAVGSFYRQPAVGSVVRLLSLTFVTSSLVVVPRALLTRDLRYTRLAAIDSIESVAAVVTTLALAWNGAGYWSLAIGTVAGRLMAAAATLTVQRVALVWPGKSPSISEPIRTGSHVMAGGIAWYLFRSADSNLVTRRLGVELNGYYAIALAFSTLPLDRLNELVNRVMPGILSDVQQNKQELERYVRRVSEVMSLVAFPIAVGLALVANDLVPVLLGAKWSPAAAPLQLLALSAAFRTLAPVLNQTLVITGNSRQSMRATITALVIMPPAFYVGTQFGLQGVAAAWLFVYPLTMTLSLFRPALRAAGVGTLRYLSALRPAAEASAVMAMSVLVLRWAALSSLSPQIRLGIEILCGAAAYPAYLWLVHRARVGEYVRWFRSLRARGN